MNNKAVALTLIERCTRLMRWRRIIVVGSVAAMYTDQVRDLLGYGATEVLVIAQGLGTGELPGEDGARTVVVPAPSVTSITEEVKTWIEFAEHPPPEAVAAVEAFDPEGTALCLLDPFATAATYCGRAALGGRTPAVAALEDKTVADGIWDASGVRRAPSMVVPVDAGMAAAAHAGLDRGAGTVWSGDAAEGMNGGGDRVRWVRTDTDAAEAIELFTHSTRHVRVMPFLEGVPCSIHGFVLADGVAAFRPVEQLVLRTPGGSRFTYAGVSTWDPQATSTETVDVTGGPATTWWGPSSWVRPTPGAWCGSYRR